MGTSFYAITIKAIRDQIIETFGTLPEPRQVPSGSIIQHLVWMCNELEKMPRTLDEAFKAARWIGWMLRVAEDLGLWNNSASQQFIRMDRQAGNAGPDRGTTWEAVRKCLVNYGVEGTEGTLNSIASAITLAIMDAQK